MKNVKNCYDVVGKNYINIFKLLFNSSCSSLLQQSINFRNVFKFYKFDDVYNMLGVSRSLFDLYFQTEQSFEIIGNFALYFNKKTPPVNKSADPAHPKVSRATAPRTKLAQSC